MSRVALSKIPSLTLYKGEFTEAHRLPPVPQLKCVGKPCKLFQPEVVRCRNNGGSKTEVDWTCEADLPERLRFGKVEVSCEGWSKSGDPNVLKGSCGLEYHLVDISDKYGGSSKSTNFDDIIRWGFICLTILLAIYIMFKPFLWRLMGWSDQTHGQGPSGPRPWHPSGSNPGRRPSNNPPPPYSEYPKPNPSPRTSRPSGNGDEASGMGFWGGLGLGGLAGAAAASVLRGGPNTGAEGRRSTQEYDWERERTARRGGGLFGSNRSSSGSYSEGRSRTVRPSSSSDRGEGSSNLGSLRQSTGYGVSNVR